MKPADGTLLQCRRQACMLQMLSTTLLLRCTLQPMPSCNLPCRASRGAVVRSYAVPALTAEPPVQAAKPDP